MKILTIGILALAASFGNLAHSAQGQQNTPDTKTQTNSYPGCVSIFNGRNFEGWEADPSTWSITNGAMRGVGGTSRLAYTHFTPSERQDPEKRIVAGPIGMFRHGGGASEYKAIYLETNPKEDRLITVP